MHNYIHVLKVAFLKFDLKSFLPHKNFPAVFARCGLLHKLLNKFSCSGLGGPMEFVPRNSSSWSF